MSNRIRAVQYNKATILPALSWVLLLVDFGNRICHENEFNHSLFTEQIQEEKLAVKTMKRSSHTERSITCGLYWDVFFSYRRFMHDENRQCFLF